MHLQGILHPKTDPRHLQDLLAGFHIEMYNRFSRLKIVTAVKSIFGHPVCLKTCLEE